MSGKTFLFIGMRGMGKTTLVKKTLAGAHPDSLLIFDPNGEYTSFTNGRPPITNFKLFAQKAMQVENAVIVVEEATVFLNNRGFNVDFLEVVVRARHTNNSIICVFHTLKSVPKYIFDLCNYVILLKTGMSDNEDYVRKQFDHELLTQAFIEIRDAKLIRNPDTGKDYSPNKFLDVYANG